MKVKKSIRRKVVRLVLSISLTTLFVIGIISTISFIILRRFAIDASSELGNKAALDTRVVLEDQFTWRLQSISSGTIEIVDEKLGNVQKEVLMLKENAEHILANPEHYNEISVPRASEENDGIFVTQFNHAIGIDLVSLQDEMTLMGNIEKWLLPIAKHEESIGSAYLGTESGLYFVANDISGKNRAAFDPRNRPWYIKAVFEKQLIWSDVYEDAYGRGLIISCAAPYFDQDGNIRGVVGVDVSLSFLNDLIADATVGATGYTFITNEYGGIIVSPTIEEVPDGELNIVELRNGDDETLAMAIERMLNGESGIEQVAIYGKDYYMAYGSFQIVPWTVATLITVEEAMTDAQNSEDHIILLKKIAIAKINVIILITMSIFFLLIFLVCIAVNIVSRQFAHTLTNPIKLLQEGVYHIANGDLEYQIEFHTEDELEDLGQSVSKMVLDLKDYISNLERVTADKERIGAELNVAKKIQSSMLPSIFPPFPERSEIDIYASMLPAKEVGGDFYDFFMLDDKRLVLVVADVSDKGVPAALFMVITKTLIKNSAQYGQTPKEVFEIVNNLLCENNDAGMFVTVFMGYLDLSTGEFTYVNAGHNPPVLCKKDGSCSWLEINPGFVLAGIENISYEQSTIILNKGDMLYLYTDGVTEAVNEEMELFSEERLLATCSKYQDENLKIMLESIKSDIDLFVGKAEQADDITMLAVRLLEQDVIKL